MHEQEKIIQEIREQAEFLQKLLNYLESKERYTKEDDRYCRGTLRQVARELIKLSRGCLVALDLDTLGIQPA